MPPQGLDDPPLPPFLSRERTSFPQELSTEELRGETGEAIKIEYGPADEPCNVRRFFVRDPFGKLVNILMHK